MPTVTTRPIVDDTLLDATLHVAFDLGNTEWTLAFTPAVGVPPRWRTMPARDLPRLLAEFEAARRHFGLSTEAPIRTCYEAGRDGFWLHRALASHGILNVIVDSASIEVTRRARQAKTDRLDAAALLRLLLRYQAGDTRVWRVVRVPTVDEEDRRHPHRELGRLTREHTRSINRIKGLLAAHGIRLTTLRGLLTQLPAVGRHAVAARGVYPAGHHVGTVGARAPVPPQYRRASREVQRLDAGGLAGAAAP